MSDSNRKNKARFERLVGHIRRGLEVVGASSSDVKVVKPGYAAIDGSGIEVVWSNNANGKNDSGWIVREVTEIVSIDSDGYRESVEVIFVTPPYDYLGAAKQAILAVAERRIEAAFDGVEFDEE